MKGPSQRFLALFLALTDIWRKKYMAQEKTSKISERLRFQSPS